MGITLKISEATKKLQDRLQCLQYPQYLATHTVEVGLTSSARVRFRTLLAIHEHGTPAMHIPARPVVKPALAQPSTRAEMTAAMLSACAAANDGDLSAVTFVLEDVGKAGVDGIHAYIDKGIPPPNSPITLSGSWMTVRLEQPDGGHFERKIHYRGREASIHFNDMYKFWTKFGLKSLISAPTPSPSRKSRGSASTPTRFPISLPTLEEKIELTDKAFSGYNSPRFTATYSSFEHDAFYWPMDC